MASLEPAEERAVAAVLAAAQGRGFLGPGAVEAHIEHALAFTLLGAAPPAAAVDLGSGGGVPGLVLALAWPDSAWDLIESAQRRATFLRAAVEQIGLAGRVRVREVRAEVAGRDPALRGRAELVVARSFGPPAVVAECAAPLLRIGGVLLVAEPPGGAPGRWPSDALAQLGLSPGHAITEPRAIQRLDHTRPCPDRYPRRAGIPLKRPLFGPPAAPSTPPDG